MSTPLELSTRRGADGTPVLTAVGEIDMSNAARFTAALGLAGPRGSRLIVDLTGVAYLDSAGINALFKYVPGVELLATPLLAPVLTISGLSGITSVRGPEG